MTTSPERVANEEVKSFWEQNPVAAPPGEAHGSYSYFRRFDNAREAQDCEPWGFSNAIHGYDRSKGQRILDVGCGNGYVLAQYARHGAHCHGIDLTQKALELSRARFALCGYPGEFKLTDGDSLDYPDATFDIVCSMGVLHHIEDPGPMVNEIRRVLKPGGTLVLMLYNKNSFRDVIGHRLKKHFGSREFRGKSLQKIRNMNDGPDCPLAKTYSKDDARALLHQFSDIRFAVNKLPWREFFVSPRLGDLMSRFLPSCSGSPVAKRWGWNLYVTAKR